MWRALWNLTLWRFKMRILKHWIQYPRLVLFSLLMHTSDISSVRLFVLGVKPLGFQQSPLSGGATENVWPSQLIITPTYSCLIVLAAPGICHNWILVSGMEELNNQIAVCLYLFHILVTCRDFSSSLGLLLLFAALISNSFLTYASIVAPSSYLWLTQL